MALATSNKTYNNLNARVKITNKSIIPNEKDVIKRSFGNDPSTPETIYNRIQLSLSKGEKASAILKVKLNDNKSYWVNNDFTPSHHNHNNQFSVNSNIIEDHNFSRVKKLYEILSKIETKISVKQANKYLDGFLEAHNISFNQLSKIV